MSFYENRILPHLLHLSCSHQVVDRQRAAVVPQARGRVLEVGMGSGLNLPHYDPRRVELVWGLEPSEGMRRKARRNVAGAPFEVRWLDLPGEEIPLENDSVDTVVLTYTLCTIPDWHRALEQMRRVLKPGGVFIFNVWDRIEENEFADAVTTALESVFPKDPPRFMARVPHGYHDHRAIERDLANGGFTRPPAFDTIAARSRATSPRIPAIAYCQGTPLRNEIEARDASRLGEATDVAAAAIAKRFGQSAVDGKIQAHVVTIQS